MIEDTIIKLESVSMVYEAERRPTIQVIDITIKRNELVYVVDPNASGKPTLLEKKTSCALHSKKREIVVT